MVVPIQIGGGHRYDVQSFHISNLQQYGNTNKSEAVDCSLQREIILYQTADGRTSIDVKLENETVWLSSEQMALLFEHVQNLHIWVEMRTKPMSLSYSTST